MDKHQQLRRYRNIFIIAVWAVAGMYWLGGNLMEKWEYRQEEKLWFSNIEWLINHPTTEDFYEFQTVTTIPGKRFPECGRPIGKVVQVRGDEMGFVFAPGVAPSLPERNTFMQKSFERVDGREAVVFIKKARLLAAIRQDSIPTSVGTITKLLGINRLNGPFFSVFLNSQTEIRLRNYGLPGTITAIENIHGTAETLSDLPISVETIDKNGGWIKLKITRKSGKTEFLVKGISPSAATWTNRVILDGKDAHVWQE